MKTLLKFSATWCQPCKVLSKVLEGMHLENINIISVDIDENSDIAEKYLIRAVPTLVLLDGDVEINRAVGSKTNKELQDFINS